MARLLARVRSRLFIHANRRVLGHLDGEYRAASTGRSFEFEELRAYAPGDEVKDIDWKATARHASPLVRDYVAMHRHEVVFLVDTGRSMAAAAVSAESKRDVAISVIGMLGFLSLRHGDTISAIRGDASGFHRAPPRGTEKHLEHLLRGVQSAVGLEGPASDLPGLLEFARRTMRGRRLLVVVTDDVEFTEQIAAVTGRLQARHEVLWVTVGDLDPLQGVGESVALYDVDDLWEVPAFLRSSQRLRDELAQSRLAVGAATESRLESLGISHGRVGASDDVLGTLSVMLRERSRVRR